MNRTVAAAILLSLFLVGCATGQYQITGKVRPKISPDAVKFYSEMPAGAEVVGQVSSVMNWGSDNSPAMMKKIKGEAAEIGANGVVITAKGWQMFVGETIGGTAFFVQ
jgi:hypothetical protein